MYMAVYMCIRVSLSYVMCCCAGGMHDCWDVYRRLVASNGRIIGMNLVHASVDEKPIMIAIVGDSAGGNLAAAVTLKVGHVERSSSDSIEGESTPCDGRV